ncbi:unnamed protein product [Polarella glacialis]|uniref:Protein kinase domain-containing protein n=1 Tax=Polarella glacialis TaxID=89957 RepID=A0A813EXB0_POLGL|nr:unnamed protein product [Polarella glacialis]CAE8650000.1 unnamed protein product [Polarella glacialis]
MVLVEEYIPGRSMESHLTDESSPVSDATCHVILLVVCNALRYLHSLRPTVAHGDLKPSNIILEHGCLRARLIDFGLSRIQDHWSRPLGGTLSYMAPEVVVGLAAGRQGGGLHLGPTTPSSEGGEGDSVASNSSFCQSDMFSYGRLAFFVATRRHPLMVWTKAAILEAYREGGMPELD